MADELWSFIETERGKIRPTGSKMASEVKRSIKYFSGIPCAIVFNSDQSVLQELENYGLEKIYFFKTSKEPQLETIAFNICRLATENNPAAIFFAANARGSELGARVAAKIGKSLLSNVIDYEKNGEDIVARKPIFRRKACSFYSGTKERPFIATINEESLETKETKEKNKPVIVNFEFIDCALKATFLKQWQLPPSEIDISEAPYVIGVGGGIKTQEFMKEIEELADTLGAAIGGSRVAISKGLISPKRQIGATGKFINADVYIPIGISGSNRHTVGLRNVKHVLPINIAKGAPIFKFAEKGAKCDLYELVPLLNKSLKEIYRGGGSDVEDRGMCQTSS